MTDDPDIDPGVDPDLPGSAPLPGSSAHRWTLPAIALGGMAGASARHGLELLWPAAAGGVPWATLVTNVSGAALLGVLMVLVVEHEVGHRLLRPFLGVGVLGGYTTFSTYTSQTTSLLEADRPALAVGYLFGTLVLALAGVALGTYLARAAHLRRAG